jgi:hypothetical protein
VPFLQRVDLETEYAVIHSNHTHTRIQEMNYEFNGELSALLHPSTTRKGTSSLKCHICSHCDTRIMGGEAANDYKCKSREKSEGKQITIDTLHIHPKGEETLNSSSFRTVRESRTQERLKESIKKG